MTRNNRLLLTLVLLLLAPSMAGCDLIGDVLEFGFWTLLIVVAIVVILVVVLLKSFLD